MPLWPVVINLLFAKLDQNRGTGEREKRLMQRDEWRGDSFNNIGKKIFSGGGQLLLKIC